MEDGAVEVKLTDLSEDVTKEQIAEYLNSYGEVLSVTDQVWDSKYRFAGRPTGARIARMTVKRNIESYITIDGQTTSVSYFGQLQTCRHCSEFVHNGISCVQNKKLLVQKTYANVTKQAVSKPPTPKPTALKQKSPFVKPPVPKPAGGKQSIHNTCESKQTKTNIPEQAASLTAPVFQLTATSRMVTRQTAHLSDGNETDCSTASGTSNKKKGTNPAKKQKPNHGDDAHEELDSEI